MKKVLSIVLSVMILIIAVMPSAAALTVPAADLRVTKGAYNGNPQTIDTVTDKVFTVVVSLPAVKGLTEVAMHIQFDKSVLKYVGGGQAYKVVDGDNYPYYEGGMFACDTKTVKPDEFSFGMVVSEPLTKNNSRDFAYLTFEVIDSSKTSTTLNFYVNKFTTEDGDNTNDISATTLIKSSIVRLDLPAESTNPSSTEPGGSDASDGGTTKAPSVSDINALIEKIKELLNNNGASIKDYIDAIINIIGNADIADMIEQLIGGNIDIGEGFLDWLKNLGIDFGSFEDILNKILDFFKNIFNPGGDSSKPSNVLTTQAGGNDLNTTSKGSQNGSENTGDAGIALAATVCVAAAAAFVLTRKKKED